MNSIMLILYWVGFLRTILPVKLDYTDSYESYIDYGQKEEPVEDPGTFRYNDSILILDNNDVDDCADGSDEDDCQRCPDSEFACNKNGNCISKVQVCDSIVDCSDGSDESNCDQLACPYPSRLCDNNRICVNVSYLCDGFHDCDDQSDEGSRCEEEHCSRTSQCSHYCQDSPEGFVCYCPAGLDLQKDKVTCTDTDPCKVWGVCSQVCIRMGSKHKCQCFPNYNLEEDGFTCSSKNHTTPYLLYSSIVNLEEGVPFTLDLPFISAMDFYYTDDSYVIFWSNDVEDSIFRSSFINNSLINTKDIVQMAAVQSLAVDWIGQNLYWTERNMKEIQVAKLNGSYRKTLISSEIEAPSAITLDPRVGYLFWVDTDLTEQAIKRCSLAGLDELKVYAFKSSFTAASDLTLDYDQRRIYWKGSDNECLRTVDYDGTDFRMIRIENDLEWSGVNVITAFGNNIYWMNTEFNVVFGVNKWNGGNVFEANCSTSKCMDIQALHPSRQPRDDPSPCGDDNGGCSHLCLIHNKTNFRCACPHATRLHADGKTCFNITIPREHEFTLPHWPHWQNELIVKRLENVNSTTIKLFVEIPKTVFDINWEIEVLYTNRNHSNSVIWSLQEFTASHAIIKASQAELLLTGLQPQSSYTIIVALYIWEEILEAYASRPYNISTPEATPSRKMLNTYLNVPEINATSAKIRWRKFSEDELVFIDGVRLHYTEEGEKTQYDTSIIHRTVDTYILQNLKLETTYVVSISFVQFPQRTVDFYNEEEVKFTTRTEVDRYDFNVSLNMVRIECNMVEISWEGIPYPESDYVRLYRFVYEDEDGVRATVTSSSHKNSPSRLVIPDLKPAVKYLLFLELYLNNGDVKMSNVQDFATKPLSSPLVDGLPRGAGTSGIFIEKRNYYVIFSIMSVLTTVATLSSIALLCVIIRRRGKSNDLKIEKSPDHGPVYVRQH